MSQINVNNIKNRAGTGAPTLGNGVVVTGVVTATAGAFSGNVSIGGTLTCRYQQILMSLLSPLGVMYQLQTR